MNAISAYWQGYNARIQEFGKHTNPYILDTSDYMKWLEGYAEAEKELNKWGYDE